MRYPKRFLIILPVLALAVLAGYGFSKSTPAAAQQDPIQARIEALQQKYRDAIAGAQENGEFTTNKYGEKVYAGETAENLKRLEKEVANEVRELKARPTEERAQTIASVDAWNDEFLYTVEGQPKQNVQYGGRPGQVQGSKLVGAESYYSQDYHFTVDPQTNTVLEVYMRPKEIGEPAAFEDMTPRYNQAQLEQMARKLIEAQQLSVNLDSLQFEKGEKIGTYFFRWSGEPKADEPTPFIQVGFTQGGQLIGYTNAGFFDSL